MKLSKNSSLFRWWGLRLGSALLCVICCAGFLYGQNQRRVVIYNQGFAQITETRSISVDKGSQSIALTDVSSALLLESLQIDPEMGRLEVIDIALDTETLSRSALIRRYVDRQITVYSRSRGLIEGRLLFARQDEVIIEVPSGKVLLLTGQEILGMQFPKLPEDLPLRPVLRARVNTKSGGRVPLRLSYLTHGLSWQALYRATIDEPSKRVAFSGEVLLENRTDLPLEAVQAELVAGDVHWQTRPPVQPVTAMAARQEVAQKTGAPEWKRELLSEYYRYTLDQPLTLDAGQKKVLPFIRTKVIPLRREYIYEGQADPRAVRSEIVIENNTATGPGVPLPAGQVMVFEKRGDGQSYFIGQDGVQHTPVNGLVRVTTGNAFDLSGKRMRLSERRVDNRTREETIEIILTNQKSEDVTVRVIERFSGEWQVLDSDMPVSKKTADAVEWEIPVKRKQEARLQFTIRQRW